MRWKRVSNPHNASQHYLSKNNNDKHQLIRIVPTRDGISTFLGYHVLFTNILLFHLSAKRITKPEPLEIGLL